MKKVFAKKMSLIILCGLLTGCGTPNIVEQSTESLGIANPWTTTDKQGVLEATGFAMAAPIDATEVVYSYMNTDTGEGKLAQMKYTINQTQWIYRMQSTDALTDISGMAYQWDVEFEGEVAGYEAVYYAYSDASPEQETIDDVFCVHVVNWYDTTNAVTYSLSATGTDLNGMDIQVYAERLLE